jgi:hypothetical protein
MRRIRLILEPYKTPTGLVAVVLMLMIVAIMANAQTATPPALNTRLILRPLTTGDISTYKLPSTTETSPGLINVGIGQAAYLEADINIAIPASDIVGVTWALTTQPAGSKAAILNNTLPAALPVFEPSDRLVYEVAGRAFLRPDVVGEYVATVTVATKSEGTATIQQTIIGATYAGITACAKCHSNAATSIGMVPSWSTTLHAQIFTQGITGVNGTSYASTCYVCHTVGNDPNTTVNNGGFNSVATQLGWTPPTTLTPSNWTNLPAALQNVANIQCENCHGPGSTHAQSGGTPYEISVPSGSGACATCHDAPTHHTKATEWYNSMHAVTTTDPAGNATCVGCHTANGFIGRMTGATTVDTSYGAIGCYTCHEPHGETAPTTATHLIRSMASVTLADGTKVSNAGEGALCMNCHQARVKAVTYAPTTAGSSHFGPHEGPQADMLEGVNGYTYGQTIPTSAHAFVATNTCVDCHMQAVAATDPAFLQAGSHTFKPSYVPAGQTAAVDLVGACQTCHGPEITTFNFPLIDYNGDGKIEGVQTEVQHLLDSLSAMLPPAGQPKTSLTIDSTWTQPQLEAAYNWLFVTNDGSRGIHNTAYTVGLLKASIADLTARGGK